MSTKLQVFTDRHREGFEAYLSHRDERGLTHAYELGRSAVARELSALDLASAHQDVLLDSLRSHSQSTSEEDVIRAAGDFFLEGLSAFEVARRALQDVREVALIERRHAMILRQLSSFLGDASLALDASVSLHEMLQLVAEQTRELVRAERCAVSVSLDDDTPTIDAFAVDEDDPGLEFQLNELSSLYRALEPPSGALRMTGPDLDRHRETAALTEPRDATSWKPRGRLGAGLTTLDGRQLGLIQAFDKQTGDFSELDEAIIVQLAQMASAAVERAQLYRRIQR
jgi:phosphoserine phosphatase RsbU-like protein/GAF domain-containing protein